MATQTSIDIVRYTNIVFVIRILYKMSVRIKDSKGGEGPLDSKETVGFHPFALI